jgi:hypothetical protein
MPKKMSKAQRIAMKKRLAAEKRSRWREGMKGEAKKGDASLSSFLARFTLPIPKPAVDDWKPKKTFRRSGGVPRSGFPSISDMADFDYEKDRKEHPELYGD